MRIVNTVFSNVFITNKKLKEDGRGSFLKFYSEESFTEARINFVPKEVFASKSRKNTIRGMHFQLPPEDQAKVVTVLQGKIVDVLLDLRVGSPTFSRFQSHVLSDDLPYSLYIGTGIAHGFQSLTDNTIVCYLTSSIYSPSLESGVRWDSFGFKWNVSKPFISDRDKRLPLFDEFVSPFRFKENATQE